MRFRSRVSVLLLLFTLGAFCPIFFVEDFTELGDELPMAIAIIVGSMLLIAGVLFGTGYTITESHMVIKIGPFELASIKIAEITSIKRSYNPVSSPAASLKRLMVNAANSNSLVSPINEKEFIRVLKSRNPNIEIEINDKPAWYRFWDWDV